MTSTFHGRLRKERKRVGLTILQLAEIGHVAYPTQHGYECGRSSPDANYLMAIGHTLDLSYVLFGKSGGSSQQQDLPDALDIKNELGQIACELAALRTEAISARTDSASYLQTISEIAVAVEGGDFTKVRVLLKAFTLARQADIAKRTLPATNPIN